MKLNKWCCARCGRKVTCYGRPSPSGSGRCPFNSKGYHWWQKSY